jgi:hypothetical protein
MLGSREGLDFTGRGTADLRASFGVARSSRPRSAPERPAAGLAPFGSSFYIFVEEDQTMSETQISAYISEATKQQVERYVEAHGVKKGFLLEEALLHHLQALRELPSDLVVPPRLTLAGRSFQKVAQVIHKPRKPTPAMRALLAGKLKHNAP